jgi:hypothetical protein
MEQKYFLLVLSIIVVGSLLFTLFDISKNIITYIKKRNKPILRKDKFIIGSLVFAIALSLVTTNIEMAPKWSILWKETDK